MRGIALVLLAIGACSERRREPFADGNLSPVARPPQPENDSGAAAEIDASALSIQLESPIEARCGEPASRTATLRNAGPTDLPFTARLLHSGELTLRGRDDTGTVRGVVPANGTADVVIDLSLVRSDPMSTSLEVSVGTTRIVHEFRVVPHGASLYAYPRKIDFGVVGTSEDAAPIDVYFMSIGDAPVRVLGFDDVPVEVEVDATFPLPAPERDAINAPAGVATVRLRAGNAGTTGILRPRLEVSAHCGPIPTFEVRGTRVPDSEVTVTPLSVSLPPRACSTGPGPEGVVRIRNGTPSAVAFAAFPSSVYDRETTAQNRSGIIAAGATDTLRFAADVRAHRGGSVTPPFTLDVRSMEPPSTVTTYELETWLYVRGECRPDARDAGR